MLAPTFSAKTVDKVVAKISESATSKDNFTWDNASVYFLLTDRFNNGNTSNDHSYGRGLEKDGTVTTKMNSNVVSFQGGDFVGITEKINEGYFDKIGVNALWVSAPYEQIQGYTCTGSREKSAMPHYAYHGYYAGSHTSLKSTSGAAFERTYDKDGVSDKVMACIGATANTNVTITVDTTKFVNGAILKNTYDNSTATVTDGKVTFKSSNSKVATVNNKGKVVAKKKGRATVTVTTRDGRKTARCTIIVK